MLARLACIVPLVTASSLYAATIDTSTGGNWIGVYGKDGYILSDYGRVPPTSGTMGVYDATADPTNDVAALPSYVSSYSYSANAHSYVWDSNSSDPRFPQDPSNPSGPRNDATVFVDNGTLDVSINLNQPQHFQLGVLLVDFEGASRVATVTLNGNDPVTVNAADYHAGTWVLYDVNAPAGTQHLQMAYGGGANMTISAIEFNPVPEPASVVLLGLGLAGLFAVARSRRASA